MKAYQSLDVIKATLSINDAGDDARLRQLIEAVTRDIDHECGREGFGSFTATRYFSGNNQAAIILPWDLIAITTLKEDANRDAVYEITWASTDYIFAPYDHDPTGPADGKMTRPYWKLEVDGRSTGAKSLFPEGQRAFELVGKFGFNESLRRVVSLLAESGNIDATQTTIKVDDGGDFEVLQTILLDTEQLYITAIDDTELTVERGVNGTTAATHNDNVVIDVLEYPSPVREAVEVEAVRRWMLEKANYASQLGSAETGVITVLGGGLRDVTKQMLDDYRRVVFA